MVMPSPQQKSSTLELNTMQRLPIVLALSEYGQGPIETQKKEWQKEIRLQDAISLSQAREFTVASFSHTQTTVRQIGSSLERIKDHLFLGGKLGIFPRQTEPRCDNIRKLHARMKNVFPEGFIFSSRSLAVAMNISCSCTSESLFDTILLVPNRPGCVFCIQEKDTPLQQTMKYVVSIAKGIVKIMRQFSNEQFSLVYGILTVDQLSDDGVFKTSLDDLVKKTSQWSVPIALSMPKEKYTTLVDAFIMCISIAQCLADKEPGIHFCLTLDQFRTVQENLQEEKVKVIMMPHCGRKILMLEMAYRLEKLRPTVLVTGDKELIDMARKQKPCSDVFSPHEFNTGSLVYESLITDCLKELNETKGTVWSFIKIPDPDKPPVKDQETKVKNEASLRNEKNLEGPKIKVIDNIIQEVFARKPEGYTASSSIIDLSRRIRALSQTGNETAEPQKSPSHVHSPELSIKSKLALLRPLVQPGRAGPLINMALYGHFASNHRSESQTQLYERTKREIFASASHTIKLHIQDLAVKRLTMQQTLVVTGYPGEGKTTLAYSILKEYLELGKTVYAIHSPEEFFCITDIENSVLMFNDLFGSFHFDQQGLGKWMPILEHLSRLVQNKENIRVIFVSRDHVLQQATRKLEKFSNLLFPRNSILNLSEAFALTKDDKKNIFKLFQGKDISLPPLSDSEIDELVELAFPFGFAHCCQLFFSLHIGKNPFVFFQNPRLFLNTVISTQYDDDVYKRVAFHLLFYGHGSFNATKLIVVDRLTAEQIEIFNLLQGVVDLGKVLDSDVYFYHFSNLQEAFESMCGLFLKKDCHVFSFLHTSIYESVANVLCNKNTQFIIEHCDVNLLDYFVHYDELGVPMSHLNCPLPTDITDHLINRLVVEMQKGSLSPVLRHSLFTTSRGVALFMSHVDLENTTKLTDTTLKQSFCYLACSNKDEKLLSEIINSVIFTKEMIRDVIFGCCEYGNKGGLLLIQGLMKEQKLIYSPETAERACILAVTNEHPYIIEILLADMDPTQKDRFDINKVFLVAASKEQIDIALTLMDMGVILNTADEQGWTALHHACNLGNVEFVSLLLNRGCDVNMRTNKGLTPLHIATRASHMEVVRRLRQLGGLVSTRTVNRETLLHMAVLSGNMDVVKEVAGYGVKVFETTVKGQTVLHYAAKHNFIDAVEFFMNIRMLIWVLDKERNTVLHIAVKEGFLLLVKMLLSKLKNSAMHHIISPLNSKNRAGLVPLHIATQNGDERMIIELLNFSKLGIDICGPNGESSLCIALQKGHRNAFRTLLLGGASVNQNWYRDGSTPLHFALQYNWDYQTIRDILLRGVNVNTRTKVEKITPLCLAVKSKTLSIVKLLLSFKPDVNMPDANGKTPLHYACSRGDLSIVSQLLEMGSCSVDQPDSLGTTPLIIASNNGSSEILKCLIEGGAKLETMTQSLETGLHLAARNGHLKATEVLLKAGSDVNTQNRDRSSPLYETSSKNHVQLVELLLRNGAYVNITRFDEKIPLHTAADLGNIRIVEMLLDNGADVNQVDNRQWSSLHFAAQNGFIEIIKLLFARGADRDRQTCEGMTCLHVAGCRGHNDLVLYLIQSGCRVDLVDQNGMNMLHIAASFCDRKTLSFLLALDLDVNVPAKKGILPAHLAAEKGSNEVAKELIERTADINARSHSGESFLHFCCLKGRDQLVSFYMNHGADLEVGNKYGVTPLIVASMFNHPAIVESLLEAGADIDHSDRFGQTPLHMAAVRGHMPVVQLLLRRGAKHKLNTIGFTPYEFACLSRRLDIATLLLSETPLSVAFKRLILLFLEFMKLRR